VAERGTSNQHVLAKERVSMKASSGFRIEFCRLVDSDSDSERERERELLVDQE
jgi:hypothetical protein